MESSTRGRLSTDIALTLGAYDQPGFGILLTGCLPRRCLPLRGVSAHTGRRFGLRDNIHAGSLLKRQEPTRRAKSFRPERRQHRGIVMIFLRYWVGAAVALGM